MNNKAGKIVALVIVLIATVGMGYIALFGIGSQKAGHYSNVSQGLDLAGGLSITYQVVGEDNPTAEDMNDTIALYEKYGDKMILTVNADLHEGMTDEEQIEYAKEYAKKYCKPGKPSMVFYDTNFRAFEKEIYKQSRLDYLGE